MKEGKLRAIEDVDVTGKRVIVRADLNVPMEDGAVSDATRIARTLPGLEALADRGAKVIVISHFGRPKGQRVETMSLKPVADKMAEMMGRAVAFVPECTGPVAEAASANLKDGEIALMENLRFHPGEEKNDPEFAAALARCGDIYVGEAFSCSHRAHASTEGLANLLPAFAGPLMREEVNALRSALDAPEPPTAAIVGGAKVSTKIPVLKNLMDKVDVLIIGGGMANTFLLAQGVSVGKSLAEPDFLETAKEIMAAADAKGCHIVLPVDGIVATELKAGAVTQTVDAGAVPDDGMILDFGPKSVDTLKGVIGDCRTVLWNGPLGAFEIDPFGEATFALARDVAQRSKAGDMVSIAGGGDTVAALNAAGVTQDFSYVSTAGGAFLEWLEGRELPGVAVLQS